MSEKETNKYYWIKLKKDFFDLSAIDFLLGQKNGAEYIVIYQMLCLITMNDGGSFTRKIGEMIVPYDIAKIQRETKYFSVDTIRVALELFKKLGLIYEDEGQNSLVIANFNDMIGGETRWAKLKRNQRDKELAVVSLEEETKIDRLVEIAKAKWL